MPSHYCPNECWLIVSWTRRNKFLWISIKTQSLSVSKMCLKVLSAKYQPFFLSGLNVLKYFSALLSLHADSSIELLHREPVMRSFDELLVISWADVPAISPNNQENEHLSGWWHHIKSNHIHDHSHNHCTNILVKTHYWLMAYCLFSTTRPSPEPMLTFCQLGHRDKLQWNFNQNTIIFIQENAFENAVCTMSAILFSPQCVTKLSKLSLQAA